MAAQNFREEIRDPKRSPVYVRAPEGLYDRLLYVLGAAHDHFLQSLWDGVGQGSPIYALEKSRRELAKDRRIPLFEGEPVPSQRKRLQEWLDAHRAAGTDAGLLGQSQPFWLPEIPMMRIVWGNSARAEWTTLNPDGTLEFHVRDASNGGSNWDWDSAYPYHTEPQTIHRGWLIVYAPPSVSSHPITVSPSETISAGSTLTVQQATAVYNLSMLNRRGGVKIWGWILAFDPASFDPNSGPGAGFPDGTWYRSYKLDGSFNRLSTARYHQVTAWTP